jgi:phosphoesterase RecJ-like protein
MADVQELHPGTKDLTELNNVEEFLTGITSLGIAGHVRPDGDAVGSTMALYLYVCAYHPEIRTDIYLDNPAPVFGHIDRIADIRMQEPDPEKVYDLFVTCDVSSLDRLSVGYKLFTQAGKTVCIDHHISNQGFADINHVCGNISSCCEVLYGLMDPEKVTLPIATALYTGMIHDTGVFQYASVTPDTLCIAARLIATGIPFSQIIEHSFYEKTYIQNQVMGRVLAESILVMDGKCIVGWLRQKDMAFYGVNGQDLDGIVTQLRLTAGVEVAIFLYETEPQLYKVSLRSTGRVDVSKVAVYFGGGGHLRAAGCNMPGSLYDVINNTTEQIELQM